MPTPPVFSLPIPNATQNYFPFASTPLNYPSNPVQFNYQSQLPLIPQAFLLQQHVHLMAQHNLLVQQIQFERAQNSFKIVAEDNRTQIPSQQNDKSKSVTRANSSNSQQVTPSAPRCQPEQIPKSTTECDKLHDNFAADTSHNGRNYSGFTDVSRGDSCISATLSENKNSTDSWANNIVDDIDDISLGEIEPFHKYTVVALNIRYPAAKLPSAPEKKNFVGRIELVNVCELISPSKFWIHLTSQYDVLTEILDLLE